MLARHLGESRSLAELACEPLDLRHGPPAPFVLCSPAADHSDRKIRELAVVAVLAESRAEAEDAAALVDVDYEELPAVADPETALAPDTPVIHPDLAEPKPNAFIPTDLAIDAGVAGAAEGPGGAEPCGAASGSACTNAVACK